MKRFFTFTAMLFILLGTTGMSLVPHIDPSSYDPGVDYMARMVSTLEEDSGKYAIATAEAYEVLRNGKIAATGHATPQTSYFQRYVGHFDILSAIYADVGRFDPSVDYMALMVTAATDGSTYAMQMGKIYETVRNHKIQATGVDVPTTTFFTDYTTGQDVLDAMFPEPEPEPGAGIDYTEDELMTMAKVLYLEAGSSFLTDDFQQKVASVMVNRVRHDKYPNTIAGVLSQRGQYSTYSQIGSCTPDTRTIENARHVLDNGSILPDNVVYQANFAQGSGIHESIYISQLRSTTYFCYY